MLNSVMFVLGILVTRFPVFQTLEANCVEDDICQGEGPLPERPCCGGLGGATCGSGQFDCNKKLGYECSVIEHGTGYCTGRFGLTVTNVSITSITISWDDFQPSGYRFEYTVFYSKVFSNDTTEWQREEHGDMSIATMYGLQPNTLYFMRVATWQQTDVIANLTEVVVISTTVLPYCYYNDNQYRVGQEFQIDCEDVCVCMTDGELECRPVCNDTSLLLPTAPNLVCREEMKGCCPTTVCTDSIPLTHKPGETSEENTCIQYRDRGIKTWHTDCGSYCNCTENGLTCYPLCSDSSMALVSSMDCRLVSQPHLCCHQWVCQPYEVHTVTVNVTLEMEGPCEESDYTSLSVLSEAGSSVLYFYSLKDCSTSEDVGVSCTIDRSYIHCTVRDRIHLMLALSFHIRVTDRNISLDNFVTLMYNISRSMTSAAVYDGNKTLPVVDVQISQPVYTCCQGFSWNGIKCVNLTESAGRLFQIYQVLERSVVLNWSLSLYSEDITSLVVCWKQLDEETQVTQIPVNKNKTKVYIDNLNPSTLYTAWLDVLVQNLTWIHLQEVHFLTTAESVIDKRQYQNYLIGVIVAMVTITVAVLVGATALVIRRKWKTQKDHIPQQNAFENKIFEIRVREDGIY